MWLARLCCSASMQDSMMVWQLFLPKFGFGTLNTKLPILSRGADSICPPKKFFTQVSRLGWTPKRAKDAIQSQSALSSHTYTYSDKVWRDRELVPTSYQLDSLKQSILCCEYMTQRMEEKGFVRVDSWLQFSLSPLFTSHLLFAKSTCTVTSFPSFYFQDFLSIFLSIAEPHLSEVRTEESYTESCFVINFFYSDSISFRCIRA